MPEERIPPSGGGPIVPPRGRRVDHLEKAQRLTEQARGKAGEAPPAPLVTKLAHGRRSVLAYPKCLP